VCELTPD